MLRILPVSRRSTSALCDQQFARFRAVAIRSVDQLDSAVDRTTQDASRDLKVGRGPVGSRPGEPGAAEPNSPHRQVRRDRNCSNFPPVHLNHRLVCVRECAPRGPDAPVRAAMPHRLCRLPARRHSSSSGDRPVPLDHAKQLSRGGGERSPVRSIPGAGPARFVPQVRGPNVPTPALRPIGDTLRFRGTATAPDKASFSCRW
jgi:hypothetical protein